MKAQKNPQSKKKAELDVDNIYLVTSSKIISEGYEEAKIAIRRQNERFDRIIRNASTMFGIITTIAIALTGAFYAQTQRACSPRYVAIFIALTFLLTLITGGILLLGVLSGRSFIPDGTDPESYYSKAALDWCKEMTKNGFSDEEKSAAFAAYRTAVIKCDMTENENLLSTIIRKYRLSIKVWFWGIALIGITYISYVLYFA